MELKENAQKFIRIPRANALSAGRRLGLAPNRLALLALPDGDATPGSVPPGWEPLLPTLAQPLAIGDITLLQGDDFLLQSRWAMGGESGLLYGEEEGLLSLRPITPWELADLILAPLDVEEADAEPMQIALSPAGLLALLAWADCVRRWQMELLLLHAAGQIEITKALLKAQLQDAREQKDIRWLAPFLLTLYDAELPVKLPEALAELERQGFLTLRGENIEPTEAGARLLAQLNRRCAVAGVRCVFYQEGEAILMNAVLLRTQRHLWYIELGADALLGGISPALARETLEGLFSPGEEPPPAPAVAQSEAIPAQEERAAVSVATPPPAGSWTCACGSENKGAFCPACGSAKPAPPVASAVSENTAPACMRCGSLRKGGAKFCSNCGNPWQ